MRSAGSRDTWTGYPVRPEANLGKARRIDLGTVIALSWLCSAAGATVVLGPHLGLRGWLWLGLHHVLCVVGSTHELWRAHKRRLSAPASR